MNRWQIPVVRGTTLRSGIPTVVGVIMADVLVDRYSVPERHSLKQTGYQRVASTVRVSRLATELNSRKVDLPTAVLISIRDVQPEDVLAEDERGYLTLDLRQEDKCTLYVVDGQHRIKALEKAMKDESGKFRNFKIPFVCMIGADEYQEMEQFYVVNSNAKSVPTDLALAILKVRSKDKSFMDDLVNRGRKWQVEAQNIVEMLAKSSQIWKNRIRLANMPKGETTVPAASMVKSLQPLMRHTPSFIAIKNPQKQMQIIDAYWKGVRAVLQDAFNDPLNFSIQKGVGVKVIHGIFPIVLEHVRSKGASIFSSDAYSEILEGPINEIEGNNQSAERVVGLDFWRTGRAGGVGLFSSAAGTNALIEHLKALLPEMEVE